MFEINRNSREIKLNVFLLDELEMLKASGKISDATYREILARYHGTEIQFATEQAESAREAKLRLGRRLLWFFGSIAVCIGLGFFVADHMKWFQSLLDSLQQIVRLFMRMPPTVRAVELTAVSVALIYGYRRTENRVSTPFRLLLSLEDFRGRCFLSFPTTS